MEDFRLDLIIGQGPGARIHPFPLGHFTLIGATTRAGLITAPLRSRFGIVHRLDFYEPADLLIIIHRSAKILNIQMDEGGAAEIAVPCRGAARLRILWPRSPWPPAAPVLSARAVASHPQKW